MESILNALLPLQPALDRSQKLYEIADILGMVVEQEAGHLYGKQLREVVLGDIALPVQVEIVSSLLTADDAVVLCRSIGNLVILVTPLNTIGSCAVFLIDAAKMKKKPDSYIENGKFKSAEDIIADLLPSVVAWFTKRDSRAAWVQQ